MRLPLFIAGRYLFAKKSHNVINIISLISAMGITVGTAALIIILSVYNGFESLIKSVYSNVESDILITPKSGKAFIPDGEVINKIKGMENILYLAEIVEENIFIRYRNDEYVTTIKGVDTLFSKYSNISKSVIAGEFNLFHGELPQAIIGKGVAGNLGININFVDPLTLYYPSKSAEFSYLNPSGMLNQMNLFPAGVFSIDQTIDNKLIFAPIEIVRELLEYDTEVTSLEIYIKDPTKLNNNIKEIKALLGDGFYIKDRFMQNETLYKMMRSEKVSIYLILLFVIIIISCNIFGSLSMLIIEKQEDISTLKALGAPDSMIKRTFVYEGWFISILGIFIGTVAAILICIAQQQFGVVPMPGNFIVKSYPVLLQIEDIVMVISGVGVIGYLAAKLPVLFMKKMDIFS